MTEISMDEFDALPIGRKKAARAALSELGRAACDYADMGFAVFPLLPRSKVPAIEGGHTDPSDDWEFLCWWWTNHPDDNVGIVTGKPSGGLVVVDVDQNEDARKYGRDNLEDWEARNRALPETVCSTTGSGGTHYLFRTSTSMRCTSNQLLSIDVKADGGYIVAPPSVHPNGNLYEWDLDPYDYDVAYMDGSVLELLAYVKATRPEAARSTEGRYAFPDTVHDGEGREHHLLTYAYSLRTQGMERAEIERELDRVNSERVIPPKPTRDIRRIAKSVCKKPAGLSPEYQAAKERAERRLAQEAERAAAEFEESVAAAVASNSEPEREPIDPNDFKIGKNGLNHAAVGQDMQDRFHARKIGGVPAVWTAGRFEVGWDAVKRLVGRYKFTARESERMEVVRWLDLNMQDHRAGSCRLVSFANGTLDLDTMELMPNSPDLNVPNVIPHRWVPGASSEVVDDTLGAIACHDADVLANLYEVIGACVCRDTSLAKAFFIINNRGANGKSTFLNFVRGCVGDGNVSGVTLQLMGERFQSTPLMGKLANIADDIPSDIASNASLATFKKVVTGDWTNYEVKGGAIGQFRPYCTCLFTMNKMPPLGDSTGGMMRRIHPIQFSADFRGNADTRRGEALDTEEAYEAAIYKGVTAIAEAIRRGSLTMTDYASEVLDDIELTNNSVKLFLEEDGWNARNLDMHSTKDLYDAYCVWADDSGVRNKFNSRRFGSEVCDLLNMYRAKEIAADGRRVYRFIAR